MIPLFAALLVAAGPPAELSDSLKWIEYDLYGTSPEDQAAWEAQRYSGHAAHLDLGSVTLKELYSIQELQANLHALDWLGFHFDLRDDRTREAEVARFEADMLFKAAPGLWLAATGSPDVWKDRGALGVGAMLASEDRSQYAIVRLLDDRPFLNGKTLVAAHRDSLVFRAQGEGRFARGALSGWTRIDLGTPSEIRYPRAPPEGVQSQGDQRSDFEGHLRWTPAAGDFDLRVLARRLDGDQVSGGVPDVLRRGFVFARGAALVPLSERVQLRAAALFVSEKARGLAEGAPFEFSRWDIGGRAAALVMLAPIQVEAGYVAVRSEQTPGTVLGDKIYGSARYRPSDRVLLRFLISKQVFSEGHFGGMNGELQVLF